MYTARNAKSPMRSDDGMTNKIFIDGEAGTTGLQIREILGKRDDVTLVAIAPEQRKNAEAKAEIYADVDVVILCLPDAAARESVALADSLGGKGPRILDASTAHRVTPGWTYGFPELATGQGEAIAAARGSPIPVATPPAPSPCCVH